MTAPTPLVMAQHTHRVVDGTRRLVFAASKTLSLGQSKKEHPCYVAARAVHDLAEIPASCQQTIRPGLFFLRYRPEFNGSVHRYCAPCAVREWGKHFDVREAGS